MIKRFAIIALGLVAGALVVAGVRYTRHVGASLTQSGGAERQIIRFIRNGPLVPEFTAHDLEGRTISSAAWRGRVTVVNFWATWCPPCRAEIPELMALQSRYPDALQVIGVSADEGEPDTVRRFAASHRINYPVMMMTPELRRAFPGVFALPTTFIVDTRGRTVQKHVGLISPAVYDAEVRVLAGLPADVRVEEVDDNGHVLLANAALATEIPGVDLSKLPPARRLAALDRLNREMCPCGCELTLAQCRINDADCTVSLPIVRKVVEDLARVRK